MAAEGVERVAKLRWVGPVLGVEHRDELAARERQSGVEGFRFGARTERRHEQDFDVRWQIEARDGAPGLTVVGFQQQFDVEFFARVIERRQRAQQMRDRTAFAIERGHHGVDRQTFVGQAVEWWFSRLAREGAGKAQAVEQQEPDREHRTGKLHNENGREKESGSEAEQAQKIATLSAVVATQRRTRHLGHLQGEAFGSLMNKCIVAHQIAVERRARCQPNARPRLPGAQGGDPPGGEAERGLHMVKSVGPLERQHAVLRGITQLGIAQRTVGAGNVAETLDREPTLVRQPGHIFRFRDDTAADQDLIGADAQKRSAAFRFRENAGRQDAAQAVKFEGMVVLAPGRCRGRSWAGTLENVGKKPGRRPWAAQAAHFPGRPSLIVEVAGGRSHMPTKRYPLKRCSPPPPDGL